jgi:hypothetical protein
MESNTTVDLQDIWGLDETHVWATGTRVSDGHSVVLAYDGIQWTTLYDSDTQPVSAKFQFSTLWTDSFADLYLTGGSELRIMTISNATIGPRIITGRLYGSGQIRGIRRNDIFDSGAGGEVAHFNYKSWHLYQELKSLNGGNAAFPSVHPTKDFVLLGGLCFTALNGFPVVIRGYR